MRKDWVLDCSAAAAFLLGESGGQGVEQLILDTAEAGGVLFVPPLFWYELLNVLTVAERRRRVSGELSVSLRREADLLPVETVAPPTALERRRIHELARRHGLTAYDAAYLELADRLEGRLRTLDPHLLHLRDEYDWIA